MRFTQIHFEKVGPFTDTNLQFKKQANLHLIHGPNEAGKSSALKQLLAFLFGFEQKSGDDFAHEYKHHRVSSHLFYSTANRALGPVVRKRGKGNTLDGAQESDLHPAHIGRSEFDRLFAIDQDRLREGSRDLFEGNSDLKTILFESMTGMSSISSIRKAIQQRKEELLKSRSGLIHDLLTKVSNAKKEENRVLSSLVEKGVEVSEYQDTCKNLNRSEMELKKQRQEKNRLERLFRGLGTLMELRQKEADLEQLGTLPLLGLDFAMEWERARDAKMGLETAVAVEEKSLNQLTEQIDLAPDPKLNAALRGRIEDLIQQIAEVEGAFRDLPEQLRLSDSLAKQIQAWVGAWFPSKIDLNLSEWLPGERERNQISLAASELQSAQSGEKMAKQSAELASQDLELLEKERKELPPIEDLGSLVSVLDDLERLGFHEQSLTQAGGALKRERDGVLSRAKRLVPPVDSEEALGRIAAPTLAEIQDIVDRFQSREKALEKLRSEIATLRNSLSVAEAELQQIQSGGVGTISRGDYEATKNIRDKAWELIRSERKGMAPEKDLVQTLIREAGTGIDLDETLTGLLVRADHQAEGLLSHAEIVSKCELLRQTINGLKRDIKDRDNDLASEVSRGEELSKAFAVQWAGWNAGPVVLENVRGLPEWMTTVSDLRKVLANNDSQAAEHKARLEDLETCRKRLVKLLGTEGSVLDLRGQAKSKIRDKEDQVKKRDSLIARLDHQKKSQAQADRLLKEAQRQLAQARETWDNLTRSLGHTVHEAERVSLAGHFQNLIKWNAERSTAADRVLKMETTLKRFLSSLAEVTAEAGTGEGPWDQGSWRGMLLGLQNLLTQDQTNESGKMKLKDQWESARQKLSKSKTERNQNRKLMEELLQQTGCANENEVPPLLERIGKKTGLERDISEMRSRLSSDMKMSLEEYIAELGDQKARELDENIHELEQLTDGLEQKIKTLGLQKQRMETILGELVGSDEAAKARQEYEDAKVRLEEAVRDWKLNHLSLLCLNQAIEKNRQSNTQSPLARAAVFFQRMTLGRFAEVEFEDQGGNLLLKVRREGREDFMELSGIHGIGLSEGTADQLWLALRLAGIEARVDDMIKAGQSPMPVILDDVLITFDNDRTKATLELLAELGKKTQVLVFTHHTHVCDLARDVLRDQVDVVELVSATNPNVA